MDNKWMGLLQSRRIWLAVVTLVVTILGVANVVPASVVDIVQKLAVLLISALTIDDTVATIKSK